jgi:D-psicose/D-tagatose/L-ribulose 3-epimerase
VGYDDCITIESFDPDIESVAKLCCIWRKLADSPEQLATEGLKFLKGVYAQAGLGGMPEGIQL